MMSWEIGIIDHAHVYGPRVKKRLSLFFVHMPCCSFAKSRNKLWRFKFLFIALTLSTNTCMTCYLPCYTVLLWYIELTISFSIGRKRTVNFRYQRLWRHLPAVYVKDTLIRSRIIITIIIIITEIFIAQIPYTWSYVLHMKIKIIYRK